MTEHHHVTRTIVPVARRVKVSSNLFGLGFPLHLEPCIFGIASRLSSDYQGGYWEFYVLSNGGFYMAPVQDAPFQVQAQNGFLGTLSPGAFGIAVCMYAYSGLSFGEDVFAETCAEHYHLLREYALDHPEVGSIMAATD